MKKFKKTLIIVIITVLILFFIFREANFKILIQEINNINIFWFIIAYTILLSTMLIISYKWKILISNYQVLSYLESIKLHFVMSSLSLITPFSAGEFINGFYKNDENFNRKIGLGASIFEKVIDVLIISLIALFSIVYFIEQKDIFYLILLTVFMLFGFLITTLYMDKSNKGLFMRIINRVIPFEKIKVSIGELILYFETIKNEPMKIIYAISLSILNWLVLIFQGYLIFKVINTQISLILAIRVISIGIFVGIIPVTISGFGTRDATFILLLNNYMTYEKIVLFGILFSFRYILLSSVGLIWLDEITSKVNLRINKKTKQIRD
ncbi:MAG: lysylphosphatidylglycerol synthase transmembrane domain-containing protein [Candidatus Woesearchaeota archaeon]